MNATTPANTTSIFAMPDTAALVSLVLEGSVAVGEGGGALLSLVCEAPLPLVPEADEEGGGDDGVPVLALALSTNAAAVCSPVIGGLTERTIPDLQSWLAAEKNHSGSVSFTLSKAVNDEVKSTCGKYIREGQKSCPCSS